MPERVRRLMDTMIFDVVVAEGMARELAELAYELTQDGCNATAQVIQDMGRMNRVRSLELRGNLAALVVARDR